MAEARRALQGCRVLDLMEEGSGLCAKLLGDWGAEVIKIEPPGGSSLRSVGPFYHDYPDCEKSLFWFGYNTGKKSITLDIENKQGQAILQQLAVSADFLVESFPPGYLDSLGLGYSSLSKVNPGLIMTSITPFGQSGPYSKHRSCELVTEAMGGVVYSTGEPEGCPIRPTSCRAGSLPHLVVELEAAASSLIANYHRLVGGAGQHIDVSSQECMCSTLITFVMYWHTDRLVVRRAGGGIYRTIRGVTARRKAVFPCKDGYAQALLMGDWFEPMVEWLHSEGAARDLATNKECWVKRFAMDADPPISQEEVNHVEEILGAFLAKHTKAEIYHGAQARGIGWCGISSFGELMANEQLKARSFFVPVHHDQLGEELIYPRAPFVVNEVPLELSYSRPPLVGEHNTEIYVRELGFSSEELVFLRESGAI